MKRGKDRYRKTRLKSRRTLVIGPDTLDFFIECYHDWCVRVGIMQEKTVLTEEDLALGLRLSNSWTGAIKPVLPPKHWPNVELA